MNDFKNILFITHFPISHIGGVERHTKEVGLRIQGLGYRLTTISEEQIKSPKIKYFGLLYIWYWFFKNRKVILKSDIIHIHDVFIWYLPLRIFFPRKKVFVTFHGWEGRYPLPLWNIINKKLANYLCNGSIAVGKYIEKWYGIKADYIVYGGVTHKPLITNHKSVNTIVWLGRQDADTGVNEFKKWFATQKQKYTVKYVSNSKNPEKYLKTAEYCVPSGYLSYLEAKDYGCKIMTFANNPLKIDYWNEIRDIYDDKKLKTIPTWNEVVDIYLKLWKKYE